MHPNQDLRPVYERDRDGNADPAQFHNDGEPVHSPSQAFGDGPSGRIPVETTDVDTPLLHQDGEFVEQTGPDLEAMTYLELRDLATERKVPGRSQMSKSELIQALR